MPMHNSTPHDLHSTRTEVPCARDVQAITIMYQLTQAQEFAMDFPAPRKLQAGMSTTLKVGAAAVGRGTGFDRSARALLVTAAACTCAACRRA